MATSTPSAHGFTGDINIPPSPVPHLLLHPNIPPSEYESALIRSAILDSQSSLSQLESRLTAVLREFRQKRKALRRYSQVHQRLLSRKPHIFPEILSSIFTLCLPSNWEDCRVNARAIPVTLSHVSVYWRNVAVSTPRLWSSMDVWLKKDVSDRTMNMFETWLSRTRGTLLSISVWASSGAEQTVTHPILELIISCCHRWRHFTSLLPISLVGSLSAVKDNLPCLESLSLRYNPWPSTVPYAFRDAFQNAPQLTDLTVQGYMSFSKLAVPWTQLTMFRINVALDLDRVIEFLHHTPNLVDFAFTLGHGKPATTRPLVQLPHLALLVVTAYVNPNNLFDCLVVPHLRNLGVSLVWCDAEEYGGTLCWDCLEPLLSLIFRSSCSIQSFTFKTQAIDVDTGVFTRCLQAMPALRDLVLRSDYNGDEFVENILCRLIHHSAEPCIVPKLVSLDTLVPSRYKTLIDMIQSRRRMADHDGDGVSDKPTLDVARLQVVVLRGIGHSKQYSDLLAYLRNLKDEGMRIDLWDYRNKPVTF